MRHCIKTISICIPLLGSLLLLACSGPGDKTRPQTPTPASSPSALSPSDIVYDPSTPEQVLKDGKQVFQRSCGKCHKLPLERQIKAFPTDGAMVVGILQMADLAKVPQEERESLLRYLLAVRYGRRP